MALNKWLLQILIATLFVASIVSSAGCGKEEGNSADHSKEEGKYEVFAECLTEQGVKMYGAYWCSHCNNQKELFGESWHHVTYVECSLPNKAGQTKVCQEAGIKAYPTWEFGDGTRSEGELSLRQLSQRSGCLLED